MQEYIEAESFCHFLETRGGLLSREAILAKLTQTCPDLERFPLAAIDYLQGIADLRFFSSEFPSFFL
jgi:hypothetical protein